MQDLKIESSSFEEAMKDKELCEKDTVEIVNSVVFSSPSSKKYSFKVGEYVYPQCVVIEIYIHPESDCGWVYIMNEITSKTIRVSSNYLESASY